MRKLLYLFTLLALAGCSADDWQRDEGLVPLSFTPEIELDAETRAGTSLLNSFSSGDVLGVLLTNSVNSSGTALSSTTYTVGTGFATQPYISPGATATVKGYYPSSASSANSFTVNSNQTTDANYKGSDLMFAAAQNATKASSSPTLTFAHKMAKIIVKVTAGSGISSITSVTLNNINRTIAWTPASGTLGALSSSGNITMSNNGAALIPPQTTSESDNFLTIVTSGGTAYYKVAKTFASGSVYTLNITVNAAALGTTTTITGWGSSASLTIQPTVTETRYVATPVGAIPGLFTINADGDQVFFSKGNLQYQASTSTWRFAENQYDYVGNGTKGNVTGSTNASISSSYSGWIDLFGWATSGYNSKNPYMTSTTNTDYGPSITSGEWTTNSTSWDWGVHNAISNGGNTAGSGWRTLTKGEWEYLFNGRTVNGDTGSDHSYTVGQKVNNVLGVVLYPDGYTGDTYTTGSNWATFESAGCVFLPAAGNRSGASVGNVGLYGNYWSSTADGTDEAYLVRFGPDAVNPAYGSYRNRGFSVRLVRRAWYKEMSSATSSDIGKIICSNGHIHTNVSDVACGGTASAMIAYVGNQNNANGNGAYSSTCSHGLAVALTDVINTSGDKQTPSSVSTLTWEDAKTACTNYKGSKPSGVTWTLPSAYQWERMLIGCGSSATYVAYSSQSFPTSNNGFGYGNFRMKLTACGTNAQGVYDVQPLYYWLSTEYSSGTSTAWDYTFEASFFYYDGKTTDCYVRAVFAF